MTRLLLDEHISPALVSKLGEKGLYAEAVAHVGLSGEPDEHIWNYALEHDFTVVTTNARDFIRLLNVEVHPGLIVLRERPDPRRTMGPHLTHNRPHFGIE